MNKLVLATGRSAEPISQLVELVDPTCDLDVVDREVIHLHRTISLHPPSNLILFACLTLNRLCVMTSFGFRTCTRARPWQGGKVPTSLVTDAANATVELEDVAGSVL